MTMTMATMRDDGDARFRSRVRFARRGSRAREFRPGGRSARDARCRGASILGVRSPT
jgi:hypothetical protein